MELIELDQETITKKEKIYETIKIYINARHENKRPIIIHINSNSLKGENELKNIRKRADGRYEWRKQIKLTKYTLIDKNKKALEKK